MYSETMELYPDSLASALSHFFRAMAYRNNGNVDKSNEDLKAVVENELSNAHPVAYQAYNTLAWDALYNSRFEEALNYWRSLKNLPRNDDMTVVVTRVIKIKD
jgi:cytochrome c-type biogenesis protein CcmH/NrfG